MSRRLAFAWVVVALATASTRAEVPYSRDLVPAQGIVFDNKPLTSLGRLGLYRQWYAAVPLAGAERLIEISLAPGLLFAQTDDGNFYTYDSETGQLLWMASLGRRTRDAQPASANSRSVYVTSGNFLFALDRQTGRPIWIEDLTVEPTSAVACDEDEVLVGLSSGKVAAFRASDKFPLWNWQTSGPVLSKPVPAGQAVAFGSHDGRLYVALEQPPTMLYRVATGGEIDAPLGTYGTHLLLVPSADKNVYAVDLFSANIEWIYPSGAPVLQKPLVAGDTVYVVNAAGILGSLDARNGAVHWTTPILGGNLVAISPTRISLKSRDGDLILIDRARGSYLAGPRATYQRAGLNLREYVMAPTNEQDDRMYFATPSGLVICLREIGQNQPRPLRDPKAPPFGHIPTEGIPATPPAAPPAEATPPSSAPAAGAAEVPAPSGGAAPLKEESEGRGPVVDRS